MALADSFVVIPGDQISLTLVGPGSVPLGGRVCSWDEESWFGLSHDHHDERQALTGVPGTDVHLVAQAGNTRVGGELLLKRPAKAVVTARAYLVVHGQVNPQPHKPNDDANCDQPDPSNPLNPANVVFNVSVSVLRARYR
jgi:hypothetical protein